MTQVITIPNKPVERRVYEWAKMFGVESKAVLYVLRTLGYNARSASTKVALPAVKAELIGAWARRRHEARYPFLRSV